jgi:uncharacterized peroxidase-related enzyme
LSFIETISQDQADGEISDIYQAEMAALGYLPNYARAFSLRPDLYRAWGQLLRTARSTMDPRLYEIATTGAAIALQSSYCALAHGEKLLGLGSDEAEVRSLVADHGSALDEQEREVFAYAGKVARSATSVTEHDIERLRSVGLTDTEIFDVAAAAAARCFFSKLLDATGTRPDAVFRERLPGLVDDLTVGRAPEEVS